MTTLTIHKLYLGCSEPLGPDHPPERIVDWVYENIKLGCFTTYIASGRWEVKPEDTVIVEAILPYPSPSLDLLDLAHSYKAQFNQEAVLYTRQDIETSLI